MSLPEFPTISPALTREDAVNQIISSIAMEELALSHIINAEGEKLQYILGTIPGSTGPQPTIEQVLDVNQSVRSVLESAAEVQSALRSKLQAALSASTMRGPTGATGATGAPGVVEAIGFQAEMINAASTIAPGENFIFNLVAFENPNISYDTATGIVTVNDNDDYDFYLVSLWYYSDGYQDTLPYSIAIYVNGNLYHELTVPYIESQITSSVIVPAQGGAFTLNIASSATEEFSLPDIGTQAKLTILGYKSQA